MMAISFESHMLEMFSFPDASNMLFAHARLPSVAVDLVLSFTAKGKRCVGMRMVHKRVSLLLKCWHFENVEQFWSIMGQFF